MRDYGYDVADHTAVDPVFGTLDDLDAVIEESHQLGIRVLLDFVPNHTSDRHPWFLAARASRDARRRDFYVWSDPAPGGGPPNNWIGVFGGPAWTLDEETGQYYMHSFLSSQPDLNWRNPAVEQAMFDVLRFWIDRGVDGFRIDAAEHVLKDPWLRDNPPAPRAPGERVKREYDLQLHVHDRGQADAHALYRRMRRLLDSAPGGPALGLAEVLAHPKPEQLAYWASFYGPALDEVHMPLNLALTTLPWDAAAFASTVAAVEAALPEGAWPTVVLGSHDEPRLASRYGEDGARLLLCLLFSLRGTPVLYCGDELGIRNSPVPHGAALDPRGKLDPDRNRDLGRTPMAWTREPHAGFTPGAAGPWLPLPAGAAEQSVEVQRHRPDSTLSMTRRLIALRHQHPALRRGSYRQLPIQGEHCFAFERRNGAQGLQVVANFGDEVTVRVPTHRAHLVFGTETTAVLRDNELKLGRREAAILALTGPGH
jgi:glycosidase